MRMFGGVPIRVTRPPSMEPKESGISTVAGDLPALEADWMATGISSARAPTLFINIERIAARKVSTLMCRMGCREAGSISGIK